MATGLVTELRALRRRRVDAPPGGPWTTAFALLAEWRLFAAAMLLVCPFAKLLDDREILSPPDDNAFSGNTLTAYVWPIVVALVLMEVKSRRQTGALTPSLPRRFVRLLVGIGVVVIALNMWIQSAHLAYLVHVATRGIDARLAFTGNRFATLSHDQEVAVVGMALGAAALSFLGIWGVCGSISTSGGRRRAWLVAAVSAAVSSVAAAGFSVWYKLAAFPRLSPDMAVAGVGGNWYQLACGGLLIAIMTGVIAYRVNAGAAKSHGMTPHIALMPTGVDTFFVLALFALWAVYFVYSLLTLADGPNSVGEFLAYSLSEPNIYLYAAIFVLALQLGWRRFAGKDATDLMVFPIHFWRFAAAWLLLATLFTIAVYNCTALAFVFWLGPWYRW